MTRNYQKNYDEEVKEILRSFSLVRPHRTKIVVIVIFTVILGTIDVLPSFVYKHLVDTIAENPSNSEAFKDVFVIGVIYFVILGAQTLVSSLRNHYAYTWKKEIHIDLVQSTSESLFALKQSFFHRTTVGEITQKLRGGVSFLCDLVIDYSMDILTPLVTATLSISILIQLDYRILIVILIAAPLYALFFQLAMNAITTYSPKKVEMEEKAGGKLIEAFNSIESTKVNSFPASILSKVKKFQLEGLHYYKEQNKRRQFWGGLAGQVSDTVLVISTILAAYLIFYDNLSLGDLALVSALSTNLLTPIRRILYMQLDFKEASINIKRLFEVLDEPKESSDFTGEVIARNLKGAISFSNVSYAYNETRNVLSNISLEIQPGSTVALVGPSGSGKTTLTKLIAGLYVPQTGVITIDDTPITHYDLTSLRKHIAIVFQDPFVLSDTIKNNLKFVNPKATTDDIERVVQLSNMTEFVNKLPDKLDTEIGERGVRLSGGQKQRLAIAQALLKNPPIIIFDEATSSLDAENERLIQEAMQRLMKDRTTIIISHRLATVIHADVIVVMKNGKIVEQGSHRALLAQKGLYEKLYKLQTKEPEEKITFDSL